MPRIGDRPTRPSQGSRASAIDRDIGPLELTHLSVKRKAVSRKAKKLVLPLCFDALHYA